MPNKKHPFPTVWPVSLGFILVVAIVVPAILGFLTVEISDYAWFGFYIILFLYFLSQDSKETSIVIMTKIESEQNAVINSKSIFDDQGKEIERSYFGSDGEPVDNQDGIAKMVASYDASGELVEWTTYSLEEIRLQE